MRRPYRLRLPELNFSINSGEFGVSSAIRALALGMLAGCCVYFSAPSHVLPGFVILTGLGLVLTRILPEALARIALYLALGVLSGLIAGEIRTRSVACDSGLEPGRQIVTGWLEHTDRSSAGRLRLYVRLQGSPCRVRVAATPGSAQLGDHISLEAVLFSPRRAAVPGGYDSRFPLYFQGIALTGYTISAVESDTGPPLPGWAGSLAQLRSALSMRIRSAMPESSGGIAAALLTGDRSHIAREDAETLRATGLGHILAISGLHMALIAGTVFFAVRLVTALLLPWSRRGNTATPAALIALIAASAYLLISGSAIPTQRAYIMTATALLALLLGRRPFSMHSLALAMIAVLMMQPESVVSPGFQMSFAAAGALIAAADAMRARPTLLWQQQSLPLRFVGGLALTSLVAGTATSAFAAFHFHRMAQYGFVANLLVMPIVSFWIMPVGLLALLTMPFGMEAGPLALMAAGLDLVFMVSRAIEAWPGAVTPIAASPGWVLVCFSVGYVLVIIRPKSRPILASGVVLIAIMSWVFWPRPNVFVSEEGVVVLRQEAGWQSNQVDGRDFARDVFMGRAGRAELSSLAGRCDPQACLYHVAGQAIVWTENGEGWREDCQRAALIITLLYIPRWIRRDCAARLIDASALSDYGAHLVWIDDNGRIAVQRVEDMPRFMDRPWR